MVVMLRILTNDLKKVSNVLQDHLSLIALVEITPKIGCPLDDVDVWFKH